MYERWKKCGNAIVFLRELYRSFIGKMSCVGWLWVTVTFLLLGCYGKPTNRICWFLKRTRTGEECQCPLRRFDEAIARFVNGDSNCWACTRHWMRASREANEYCSSPFLEHSTQLSKRSIPKRFYFIAENAYCSRAVLISVILPGIIQINARRRVS